MATMADDDDDVVKECFPEMSEHYLEAACRLPIADIPYLATCLARRGLAVGLCDPVSSILLTTIHALALDTQNFPPELILNRGGSREEAVRRASDRLTFVDAVHRSRLGQITFMTCYFRYLAYDEAKRCLDVAGHDLPGAVSLVQRSSGGSLLGHPDPDSATTKAALENAFYSAWISHPQPLVRLMTSRYRRDVLDPVLEVLRYRKQLTPEWVYRIGDLLCHPCSPPPIPMPMLAPPRAFRDSSGQVTTTILITNDLLFPAPRIVLSQANPVSMAIITSPARPSHGDDDTVHLSTALAQQRAYGGDDDRFRSWEGHTSTWFLKMSLLETMHELYIAALARLPLHHCHLVRAVLAAGHSYGPMRHPVANIIFNAIWYDALFPSLDEDGHDILDPGRMSRAESRSLDGVVALICDSYCVTRREALEQLCKDRGELALWARDLMLVQQLDNIDDVLLTAKHAQPAAYKAFIQALTSDELYVMRGFMTMDRLVTISHDAVCQLKEMITEIAAARGIAARPRQIPPAPLSHSTLETNWTAQVDYVRVNLKQLLDDYSLREGQQFHVGLICGVAKEGHGCYSSCTCYHVNFLASTVPNGSTTPTPMYKLFFAEFWSHVDGRIEESTKPPICCAIQDSPKHFGRCNVCERSSSTIVHPPCSGYYMADTHGRVFRSAESLAEADVEADPGDFNYLDAEKDRHVELEKMIAGQSLNPLRRQFPDPHVVGGRGNFSCPR